MLSPVAMRRCVHVNDEFGTQCMIELKGAQQQHVGDHKAWSTGPTHYQPWVLRWPNERANPNIWRTAYCHHV